MSRGLSLAVLLGLLLAVGGCTSLAEHFAATAAALGMKRELMVGDGFRHVIYSKPGEFSNTLHVYIDGDGSPWIAGRPADDPTPRNSLILRLMELDHAPAAYVGRPCYHGMHTQQICSSRFWLSDRYSEPVVDSLLIAIEQLLKQGRYPKLALFGHSGGGTLATLLAARLPETVSLVTVAANLDVAAWARYTEDPDLRASLNPATLPAFAASLRQYHFAGARDQVVPPALMAAAVERLGSRLKVIEGYDHVCCWERAWAGILADLAAAE